MNRARNASGINSYEKEFGFAPQDYLLCKIKQNKHASWIDICCGQGNALIQTGLFFEKSGLTQQVALEGIDLIDTFPPEQKNISYLSLMAQSLAEWQPEKKYDLITCVHGLHYLGDKLAIISTAIKALTTEGLFIANLDLDNFNIDGLSGKSTLLSIFKANKIEYNRRRRIIKKEGTFTPAFDLNYLGANDQHGPNYTGQDSVTSCYTRRIHSQEV
jgi:SAM-dependent methyltransferase